MPDSTSGSDKYDILSVTCRPEDSSEIEHWIASTFQAPVLVEEGATCRLSFGSPFRSLLETLVIEEALRSLGALDFRTDSYERKDWQELWKEQGFKRFSIKNALTVLPAWDKDPTIDPRVVIDPQMAFGTGWHETTRTSLELLWRFFEDSRSLGRILDFGSGTGILGIAGLRLDPLATLVAIDNDPYAVEATTANLKLNGCEQRGKVFGEWEVLRRSEPALFRLILANVTEGVIKEVSGTLWDLVEPGGRIIFSGIEKTKAGMIEERLFSLTDMHESYPGSRYHTYCLRKGDT